MIKIIRHGENPPYRRAECHNCGCVFEYQKSDMQSIYNGGEFEMHLIQCPQCGKSLKIPEWEDCKKPDASIVDLRAIKEWCDERSLKCEQCPLFSQCERMFFGMSPNGWQDGDIEAFEKEIRE